MCPHYSADTQPICVPSELPQIVSHLVSIQEIRLHFGESYQFRPMPEDLEAVTISSPLVPFVRRAYGSLPKRRLVPTR